MSADEFRAVAPDPQKDREQMLDLVAKSFGDYFAFLDRCRSGYIIGSHYDWNVSRVGILDGQMVTHWGVWDYRMRIGRSLVRAGGIGAVCCRADYRKRGLMARTAPASIAAMRDAGYDMSVLFGIRDFYHRFGYVRAWCEQSYVVSTSDLPAGGPTIKTQRLTGRHRDELAAVYNRRNRSRTGTALRPTYLRKPLNDATDGVVWRGADGKAAGWLAFKDNHCVDHGGDLEQVLGVLGAIARKRGLTEVRFHGLHFDSDLCKHLRRNYCRYDGGYARSGGAMVRTVNLRGVLGNIAPELSRRLARSHLAGWKGRLLIADRRERVMLSIRGGKVSLGRPGATKHAIRGGDEIAQLLIGTDEPGEIVEAGKIRLTGDAKQLVEVLFPNQHPMLGTIDGF